MTTSAATTSAACRPIRALPLAAALALATFGLPALAQEQGTAEQREACAPDAVKLCSDTIPDVGRTTACMKAHVAELSPRCRVVFNEAVGTPAEAAPEERRVARAPAQEPVDEPATAILPLPDVSTLTPGDDDQTVVAPAPRRRVVTRTRGGDPETREARRVIASLCRNATLDASTCRVAGFALDLAR